MVAVNERPCWFVGAAYGGWQDQTDQFIEDGIWRVNFKPGHRYTDKINSMQPGDRIAIKAFFTQKHNLPFEARPGRTYSGMHIKAIGTITGNPGDGQRVGVAWTKVDPPRDWYFYTNGSTVWEVRQGQGAIPERANALIRFAFHNEPQDYTRFSGGAADAATPWGRFIEWAASYIDSGELEEVEVAYKLEMAESMEAARLSLAGDDDAWKDHLRAALDPKYNFLNWRKLGEFREWCQENPEALNRIWAEDEQLTATDRIVAFASILPSSIMSGPGTRAKWMAGLLMGVDAREHPPFQKRKFDKAYELTGYEPSPKGAGEAALYEHALGFFDKFMDEAQVRGLPLRHRLDAQSLVWAAMNPKTQPPAPPLPMLNGVEPIEDSLDALARRLYFPDASRLRDIESLLEEKKQVIFYGPPGTGKTYVAKALARHLAGDSGSVDIVQFHPSYAYEDFVQGYRPVKTDGGLSYELTDGPLLRAAKRAEEEEDADHFLVIDEINRGNLAKVFGELYFLLEYREEQLRLQYSREEDDRFSLPDNLYIIGTMNTADRSIALVDLALRRRFYFQEFHPDKEPVKGLLARFLEGNDLRDMRWVASFVDAANEELADHEAAIGPSHFMKPNLDEDMARRVWKHAIRPYIEERLQDERDDARQRRLKRFDDLWERRGEASPATDELSDDEPDADVGS